MMRYYIDLLNGVEDRDALHTLLTKYSGDSLAFYYKALVDRDEQDEYFGVTGQYTDRMLSTMNSIESFYNHTYDSGDAVATSTSSIASEAVAAAVVAPTGSAGSDNDIDNENDGVRSSSSSTGFAGRPSILLGVHGADLQSRDARIQVCQAVRNSHMVDCDNFADELDDLIQSLPYQYNSPILTMNAFVANKDTFKTLPCFDSSILQPSVLLGDGLLQYLEDSDAASDQDADFILSHEYAHVLQMESNLLHVNSHGRIPAAVLAKMELQADALGAYFMSHRQGGGLSTSEIDEIVQRAANLGDFVENSSSGGHGSPGQRECAAIWGARHAKNQFVVPEEGRRRETLQELLEAFDQVHHQIVNGDASVCPDRTAPLDCDHHSGSSSSSSNNRSGGRHRIGSIVSSVSLASIMYLMLA